MSKERKILLNILSGTQDANVSFIELQHLLKLFGFSCRVHGDHFIYTKSEIDEIINIQPNGTMAKPYQVKQVRNIIIKYKMGGSINE